MGISGLVAGGVNDEMEQVLKRRLQELVREQQEQQSAAQLDMDRQQLASSEADRAEGRNLQRQTLNFNELQRRDQMAQQATQAAGRSDMANVLNMPGMSPEQMNREIAGSSIRTGAEVPKQILDLIRIPEKAKPVQYTYTDPKTGNKSLRFANTDAIPDGGLDMGNEPQKPTAAPRPGTHVIDGALVDDTGRVIYRGAPKASGNAIDPVKAKEVLGKVLEEATKLRNAPGLSSLTGARIGNPDYALGVSEEPLAGTPAATAKTYYDSVKALLTMENLGLMKGVLSETDMKVLQSASTSLNTAMQDPAFVAELDNIIEKARAGLGQPAGQMTPASSHGVGAGPRPRMRFDRSGKPIP